MARLRLLHWKAAEAQPLLELLTQAGHHVEYEETFQSEWLRCWRKSPPDAFIIDLSRLPSQGREIAVALKQSPATRRIPIVFCAGEAEKVARIRTLLPEAIYCDVAHLKQSVSAALKSKPADTPVPPAMMNRYADRTAAQKLGIRAGCTVALIEPPSHVEAVLGALPENVEFVEDGDADITLCFVHDTDSLRQAFSDLRRRADKTKLWMLWRKKTSSHHAGITEPAVRETGTSMGLVDYKICSVDKTWSGMLFARKRG